MLRPELGWTKFNMFLTNGVNTCLCHFLTVNLDKLFAYFDQNLFCELIMIIRI